MIINGFEDLQSVYEDYMENEKIKNILTEEQYKKYQEMFQRHNNRPDGNSQNQ